MKESISHRRNEQHRGTEGASFLSKDIADEYDDRWSHDESMTLDKLLEFCDRCKPWIINGYNRAIDKYGSAFDVCACFMQCEAMVKELYKEEGREIEITINVDTCNVSIDDIYPEDDENYFDEVV